MQGLFTEHKQTLSHDLLQVEDVSFFISVSFVIVAAVVDYFEEIICRR